MKTQEKNVTIAQDDYCRRFTEEEEFYEFMKERDENASWMDVPAHLFNFITLEEGTLKTEEYREKFKQMGKEEIFADTLEQSALLGRIQDDLYPIRKCAIEGVLERLGISGQGLKRLSPTQLENVLNILASRAKGTAMLYNSDGKISGVHSGNLHAYSKIPALSFFERVMDYLYNEFSCYSFLSGEFKHSLIVASWTVEGLENNSTFLNGPMGETIKPVIRAVTSDTGASSASLYPGLAFSSGLYIPLGSPLKVLHRHGNTLSDVDRSLEKILLKIQKGTRRLGDLLDISLNYPISALCHAMKEAKLPVKKGEHVLENYNTKLLLGKTGETAYDVYKEISQSLSFDAEKTSYFAKLNMEENILRLLYADWKKFDHIS